MILTFSAMRTSLKSNGLSRSVGIKTPNWNECKGNSEHGSPLLTDSVGYTFLGRLIN